MERILELLHLEGGVLPRWKHRTLTRQLDHCVRRGRLHAILPGVYTAPEPSWEARVRAAAAFRCDGVITGAAAAKTLWWPECPITSVSVALPHGTVERRYPGFEWERRPIPPELIVHRGDLRFACPALSVLDLIPAYAGEVIDEALRRRSTTLAELWQALEACRHRPGNAQRRALLHDSRDEPWSEAERLAHRLLRAAQLSGWRTNYRIRVDDIEHFADLAFPHQRVIIEIDGWEHHGSRSAFVADRWRYARLAAAKWSVMPFAAEALTDDPEGFVALVRTALSA
ncbi:MAG: DUF559 domain-containing protein [Micropruina sp.]|nr:DUF559 domain-containing protein [Micropruina sp.]